MVNWNTTRRWELKVEGTLREIELWPLLLHRGKLTPREGRWHTPPKLGHHQKRFVALDFLCETLLLFVIKGLSPGFLCVLWSWIQAVSHSVTKVIVFLPPGLTSIARLARHHTKQNLAMITRDLLKVKESRALQFLNVSRTLTGNRLWLSGLSWESNAIMYRDGFTQYLAHNKCSVNLNSCSCQFVHPWVFAFRLREQCIPAEWLFLSSPDLSAVLYCICHPKGMLLAFLDWAWIPWASIVIRSRLRGLNRQKICVSFSSALTPGKDCYCPGTTVPLPSPHPAPPSVWFTALVLFCILSLPLFLLLLPN